MRGWSRDPTGSSLLRSFRNAVISPSVFSQAARRAARKAKAAAAFPRPVGGALRPAVRCPTVRYNRRLREGRGFSVQELKAAGVTITKAKSLGVAVDLRRVNYNQEGLQTNVERLQNYMKNLVVFSRKGKAVKAGELPSSLGDC